MLPRVHRAFLACPRRRGCGGLSSAACEENRDQAEERQCNQVLIHCAIKTDQRRVPDGYPTGNPRMRELLLMKARSLFAVLALNSFALAGCATNTATTAQTQPDQTTTRVHTQEELRKSGESQTGPALEKSDAAVRMSGPR